MFWHQLAIVALGASLTLTLAACDAGGGAASPAASSLTAKSAAPPAAPATLPPGLPAAAVPEAPGTILFANDEGLGTLEPRTLAARRLSQAGARISLAAPAVSPDGKLIVYSLYDAQQATEKRDNGTDLFLMNADGSNARVLLAHDAPGVWLGEPVWQPDGRGVLYTRRDADGKERIERLSLEGGGRSTVVEDAATAGLSADGQLLTYLTTDAQSYAQTLWAARADGSGARRLVGEPEFQSLAVPRVAPDGQRLAFVAIGGPDRQPPRTAATTTAPDPLAWLRPPSVEAHGVPYNIWVINADGTNLQRLTLDLEVEIPALAWSPDGRWLGFESDAGLNLVSADGRDVRYLGKYTAIGGLDWYATAR